MQCIFDGSSKQRESLAMARREGKKRKQIYNEKDLLRSKRVLDDYETHQNVEVCLLILEVAWNRGWSNPMHPSESA